MERKANNRDSLRLLAAMPDAVPCDARITQEGFRKDKKLKGSAGYLGQPDAALLLRVAKEFEEMDAEKRSVQLSGPPHLRYV